MSFNILKLVDNFDKKLKSDNLSGSSDDPKLHALRNSLKIAIELDGIEHPDTMLLQQRLDEYIYSTPSAWEKFVQYNCDKIVRGAELQSRMTEALVEAGYAPKSKLTGVCRTFLITLRPSPVIQWDDFYTLTQKYLQRKFLIKYYAVYEQTGETSETQGTGFHMHILCESKNNKPKILQDTKSTFRGVVADNCIQIDFVRTPEDWHRVLSYLRNWKLDDPEKQAAARLNTPWRESLGLPEGYNRDISLPNQVLEPAKRDIEITEIS